MIRLEVAAGDWWFRFTLDTIPSIGSVVDAAAAVSHVVCTSRDDVLRVILVALGTTTPVWNVAT